MESVNILENKRNLYIGIAIIAIVAGSVITGAILLMPPAETPPEETIWPTAPVPSVKLYVNDVLAAEKKNMSMQQIVTMLQADETKLRSAVVLIGGVNRTIWGFNPLDVLESLGYWDPFNVLYIDVPGTYSRTINTTDLYMRDSEFNSDYTGVPIFVGIVCDKQWLNASSIQSSANYGNFSVFGNTRAGNQRVKNLATMNITSHWQVAVKVNGVTEFVLDRTNITVNESTHRYGYSDNATGKNWDNTFTGRTLADIVNCTTAKELAYTVNFTTLDDWGSTWKYNKTEIQNGLPPSSCSQIGTPPETLSTNGLLMTIYTLIAPGAGTPTHNLVSPGGPFRLVVPGLTRNYYMKLLTEIKITIVI